MITRIVMLNFQPEKIAEFLEIFNQNKQVLAKIDGCIHLEIFKSTSDIDTYFTISNWQSEEHLERYRQSEFFKEIWSKVKPLFNNKAQAWTLKTLNGNENC